MREMRRRDRKITEEAAKEILRKGCYGVLSTIGEDSIPYGVPLNYVYYDNHIYFHCAKNVGHKVDNINYSKYVCFTVVGDVEVKPSQFSTNYESSIAFGIIDLVEGREKKEAMLSLLEKYTKGFIPEGMEYMEKAGNSMSVYRITVTTLSGKSRNQ